MNTLKNSIGLIIIGLIIFFSLRQGDISPNASAETSSCKTTDISIKTTRIKWVDECKRSPCTVLRGTAVLTNNCSLPVGVEVKITGFDKHGTPIATRDLWPASTNNIAPGDYVFSLDQWLDYDPAIKTFSLSAITVKAR